MDHSAVYGIVTAIFVAFAFVLWIVFEMCFCQHKQCGFPMTWTRSDGTKYTTRQCLYCGKRLPYNLETMKIDKTRQQ